MTSARRFFVILAVVLPSLTGFLPVCLDVTGSQTAFAAAAEPGREQPTRSKRTGSSRVSITPTTFGPTTIQNFRTAISQGVTRLVLDLDRRMRTPKRPASQAEGIVIDIPNATLSRSALNKLSK